MRSSRNKAAQVPGTLAMLQRSFSSGRSCELPLENRALRPLAPDRVRLQTTSLVPHAPAAMGKMLYGVGDIDLLHPPAELEARKHKLKRKIPTPNSFFMDVKCPGCYNMCAHARHAGCTGRHPGLLCESSAARGGAGA